MRGKSVWQFVATIALFACVLGATAPPATSRVAALKFLVGNWSCTYESGSQRIVYPATYAYAFGESWLRELDTFADGGSAEETLTFDPKRAVWTAVILDSPGTATILRANGSDARHLVYRSVYPDTTISETFDRLSPTRFTLHYAQRTDKKTIESADICVKKS